MKLEHRFEDAGPQHTGLLAAAALAGCDLEQTIPGSQRMIAYGATKYGYGPICAVDFTNTAFTIEPHVTWFPWTPPKSRLASFEWAMDLFAQTHVVLLNVAKENIAFFEHYVKKNYLRKIGYIEALPEVEEIHMYQVNRRKA